LAEGTLKIKNFSEFFEILDVPSAKAAHFNSFKLIGNATLNKEVSPFSDTGDTVVDIFMKKVSVLRRSLIGIFLL
jgi:hypothetical protein